LIESTILKCRNSKSIHSRVKYRYSLYLLIKKKYSLYLLESCWTMKS